ncbi:MAG: AMP-binding protein, partial [Gammaproteobacteria bacterium]|nr:AMP-binding protein [Gammaproteobacteria bacterium]
LGVRPGERVALMAGNSVDFVVCFCAIVRLGAIVVPINLAYKGGFLEHILNSAGARMILAEVGHLEVLCESWSRMPALDALVVLGAAADIKRLPAGVESTTLVALESMHASPPSVDLSVSDPAALMYTSGTTGPAKGVIQPHGHILLMGHLFIEHMALTPEDRLYTPLPLFHANALGLHLATALELGIEMVLDDRFHATRWLDTIRRYGATSTNLLGVMGEFILSQPERPDDADNPLRSVNCVPIAPGRGPVFEARFGCRFTELYGTTEVSIPIFTPRDAPVRPGAAGKMVDRWFEGQIVDPDTDQPLGPDQVGEMVFRPKVPWCFMQGYFGNPAATVDAWRNFWFHTGDAGKQDAEGWFYFVDRMRDCLRRRGENISSFEVESVIAEHVDVQEVAVVGIDAGIPGGEQEVLACVVPATHVDRRAPEPFIDALIAHCEARMPAFAVPRYVRVMDALPRTPTEKVRKQALRDEGVGGGCFDRLQTPAASPAR